jgi:hypothetical protein
LHFHRPSIPKLLFQACSTRITIEVNECHQKAFKLLGDMSKTFKHITHPKSTSYSRTSICVQVQSIPMFRSCIHCYQNTIYKYKRQAWL